MGGYLLVHQFVDIRYKKLSESNNIFVNREKKIIHLRAIEQTSMNQILLHCPLLQYQT